MKQLAVLGGVLVLCLTAGRAQTDTNTFDASKVLHFWGALQGSNAVHAGGFGDSVVADDGGGKMAGFAPALKALLGNGQSGGVNGACPYLCYNTNGVGVLGGPDTNWWWYHHYLTNGSVVTFLAAIANGPSNNSSRVWCDTIAVYYLADPAAGSFTISLSTNGGPFGIVRNINAAGPRAGTATNISVPLNYYQMQIACTSGTLTLIDAGMWNEHQRGYASTASCAPGMAYEDWTSVPTNITWPIFKAWHPALLLMEAKDSADSFQHSLPLLEQMFTNCAPQMDVIYIGTTALTTNGDVYRNDEITIPQNNVMADMARRFGRAYWNSFGIVSYEQATAWGWTKDDGAHFNLAGGMALGMMLWNDMWASLHRMDASIVSTQVALHWYALTGRQYQVQYNASLSLTGWQNVGGPIVATNLSMNTGDSASMQRARFYRVVLLP